MEDMRDSMMQMVRAFLLGVPLGAEVEGDASPKSPIPNKTGLKPKTPFKTRIEKMIKKPSESDSSLSPDEDDIFAQPEITRSRLGLVFGQTVQSHSSKLELSLISNSSSM